MTHLTSYVRAASIVYYIRVDEDTIKIGTTGAIDRFTRHAGAWPDMQVLAVEPGNKPEEDMRHQQFAAHRLGAEELFRAAPDLVEHVDALVAELRVTDWWHGQRWSRWLSHYPWFTDDMLPQDTRVRSTSRGAVRKRERLAAERAEHVLTNVDEYLQRADCSKCGVPVRIQKYDGAWRCYGVRLTVEAMRSRYWERRRA